MPSPSLKTRISLALVVAFVLVASIATAFAKASFRESEVRHLREASLGRVEALSDIVDQRFLALGQEAKAAANAAGQEPPEVVLEQLRRAGFVAAVVLGPGNEIRGYDGDAIWNETLREQLAARAPPPNYPSSLFTYKDGWLGVAARSTDLKTAVVGGMSREFLSDTFLVDALIHPETASAIVLRDGQVVAASANYPAPDDEVEVVTATTAGIFEGLRSADEVWYADRTTLVILDGSVEGLTPGAAVAERVDEMTLRFVLSMVVAFGLGGGLTISLVVLAFRPLDRITESARRLGRGEPDLRLPRGGRDEIGMLAEAMRHSAGALADARRAEAERAEQARLNAEQFELAVGDLGRSVAEAATPAEVAQRLCDATLRVTSARAVAVLHDGMLLDARERADAGSSPAAQALFESAPDAFARFESPDAELALALLPAEGRALPPAESRKVDILLAQGLIAIHRADAMQALDLAFRQKEVFLDILSHDLKNPLAIARGRVELLVRKDETLARSLAPVEASLDRAARLIEEAVLYSRLERGAGMEREPLDARVLAEESVASLAPLAAQRPLRLVLDAPHEAPFHGSRLLQRAVENLVSNAIKWSPEEAEVCVKIDRRPDVVAVRVIDHGPGIPVPDRARLFERFERADRAGVQGTGLGLAIAKRVVDMHQGRIRIEDTPGGGCTFVVEIPVQGASA